MWTMSCLQSAVRFNALREPLYPQLCCWRSRAPRHTGRAIKRRLRALEGDKVCCCVSCALLTCLCVRVVHLFCVHPSSALCIAHCVPRLVTNMLMISTTITCNANLCFRTCKPCRCEQLTCYGSCRMSCQHHQRWNRTLWATSCPVK